jgi:hypothetical protein
MAILLWTDDGQAASNGRIYRVERKSDQLLPLNWRAYRDGRSLGDFPSYYVAQVACEITEACTPKQAEAEE